MKTAQLLIVSAALTLPNLESRMQSPEILEFEPAAGSVRVIVNATETGKPGVTQFDRIEILGYTAGSASLIASVSQVRGVLHIDTRSDEGASTVVAESGFDLLEDDGPPS